MPSVKFSFPVLCMSVAAPCILCSLTNMKYVGHAGNPSTHYAHSVLDKDVVDVFLRIFSSAFLLYMPLGCVLECSKCYCFGRMSSVCMNVMWFTRQMHSNGSNFKLVVAV
jgi:hypothetical protein